MKVVSSLPKMKPVLVTNVRTGEVLSTLDYENSVKQLIAYVRDETERLFQENKVKLADEIRAVERMGSANSFARQRGYTSTYKTLGREILAKSRINELVLHKLVSEVASYVNNPNPLKQEPSFAHKINLGAVNKQMVKLAVEDDNRALSLRWKCWDRELLLEFSIPEYYAKRSISKWSLPTVQIEKGEVRFYFPIQENPDKMPDTGARAGVDLGRVETFSMAVVDSNKDYHFYTGNKVVKRLEQKRNAILKERNHIFARLDAYRALGIEDLKGERLVEEADRKRGKIRRLAVELAHQVGNDIALKLERHRVHEVVVEDLSWVAGKRYGGRWNHSVQKQSITHALARRGVRVTTTRASGTSQHCHKCKSKIIHNTKARAVHCITCKTNLDRDFNAALNILKKQSFKPINNTTVSAIHGNNGLTPQQEVTLPAGSGTTSSTKQPET